MPGSFGARACVIPFGPTSTKDWLLIYTRAGSGLYGFPGGEFVSAPEHDITLYRPGFFQEYQVSPATRRWDVLYAHFLPREQWLPWLSWPEISPRPDATLHRRIRECAVG